jgi:hypothetical protein
MLRGLLGRGLGRWWLSVGREWCEMGELGCRRMVCACCLMSRTGDGTGAVNHCILPKRKQWISKDPKSAKHNS